MNKLALGDTKERFAIIVVYDKITMNKFSSRQTKYLPFDYYRNKRTSEGAK